MAKTLWIMDKRTCLIGQEFFHPMFGRPVFDPWCKAPSGKRQTTSISAYECTAFLISLPPSQFLPGSTLTVKLKCPKSLGVKIQYCTIKYRWVHTKNRQVNRGPLSPPAAAPDSHRPNSPALLMASGADAGGSGKVELPMDHPLNEGRKKMDAHQTQATPQNCRAHSDSRPNFVHTWPVPAKKYFPNFVWKHV